MLLDADATESAVGGALPCARRGAVVVAGRDRRHRGHRARRASPPSTASPTSTRRSWARSSPRRTASCSCSPRARPTRSSAAALEPGRFLGPTAACVLRVGDEPGTGSSAGHTTGCRAVQGVAETVRSSGRAPRRRPGALAGAIESGPLDSAYAQLKGKAMIEGELRRELRPRQRRQGHGLILEGGRRQRRPRPGAGLATATASRRVGRAPRGRGHVRRGAGRRRRALGRRAPARSSIRL